MMTMKIKMKEPGWRKKRERTKDLTGIEREREKGKMPNTRNKLCTITRDQYCQ